MLVGFNIIKYSYYIDDITSIKNSFYLYKSISLQNHIVMFIITFFEKLVIYLQSIIDSFDNTPIDKYVYYTFYGVGDTPQHIIKLPMKFTIVICIGYVLISCDVYEYTYNIDSIDQNDITLFYDFITFWVSSQPTGSILYTLMLRDKIVDYLLSNLQYILEYDTICCSVVRVPITTLCTDLLKLGLRANKAEYIMINLLDRTFRLNTNTNVFTEVESTVVADIAIAAPLTYILIIYILVSLNYNIQTVYKLHDIVAKFSNYLYECAVCESRILDDKSLRMFRKKCIASKFNIQRTDVIYLESCSVRIVHTVSNTIDYNLRSMRKPWIVDDVMTTTSTTTSVTDKPILEQFRTIQLKLNNFILDVKTSVDSDLPDIVDDTVDFTKLILSPEQWDIYWSHAGTDNIGIKVDRKSTVKYKVNR